ncbi:Glutamine-binding periplasmic protein [compost metagenome]
MFTRIKKAITCLAFAMPMLLPHAYAETLRVGSTPTAVPFNFLDPKTNSLQGVMIDVTQVLSQELGFTPEQFTIPLSGLVSSLQTNKIDLISSAFAMNEQRAKAVDFSDALFTYGEAVIVNANDPTPYSQPSDFSGKSIGLQTGSVLAEPFKVQAGIKSIKMYDSMADMIRDVSLSRIDAAIGDGPVMLYTVKHSGYPKVRVAETYHPQIKLEIGIAVRKGNTELLDRINQGVRKIKQDGTLDAILHKWDVKKS